MSLNKYDSREDLAAKIEWEGGIDGALSYGISADEMPEGDDQLTEAWRALEAAYEDVEYFGDIVMGLLEGE